MSDKRMFSRFVVSTDKFKLMPIGAQALYFQFGVCADDDGFVDSPISIQRSIGASDNDFNALLDNGFVYKFKSGIIVVIHWNLNNNLRSDAYKETIYRREFEELQQANTEYLFKPTQDRNKTVTKPIQDRNKTVTKPTQDRNKTVTKPTQDRNKTVTQSSIVEVSKDKDRAVVEEAEGVTAEEIAAATATLSSMELFFDEKTTRKIISSIKRRNLIGKHTDYLRFVVGFLDDKKMMNSGAFLVAVTEWEDVAAAWRANEAECDKIIAAEHERMKREKCPACGGAMRVVDDVADCPACRKRFELDGGEWVEQSRWSEYTW